MCSSRWSARSDKVIAACAVMGCSNQGCRAGYCKGVRCQRGRAPKTPLVLINGGNAHTLDLPATLAALNHVMIYLPEFDLYDDPTASFPSFGVLSETTPPFTCLPAACASAAPRPCAPRITPSSRSAPSCRAEAAGNRAGRAVPIQMTEVRYQMTDVG